MTRSEFLLYNDHPCRFKTKSGKAIFGVIREMPFGNSFRYYFATLGERTRSRYLPSSENIGQLIDLNDVVGAELLSSSDLMVG